MKANEAPAAVETAERKERVDAVDFKMVTFSLAGKDYGIDIMNVKEIAKAGKFTFVPNAAPFLRGVYNLRGEIIPVIDLRVFFHLPAERKEEDALESTLILRIDEHVFGVIVDNIDKVVGIASASIQPPHPIFGDINIKYIKGVVENTNRLYIILDVVRIFAPKEEEKAAVVAETAGFAAVAAVAAEAAERATEPEWGVGAASELDFIKEALLALKHFAVTDISQAWAEARFAEWRQRRGKADLQLKHVEDADAFLETFYSPDVDRFWDDDYAQAVTAVLQDNAARTIQVWNPGCGKGFETYSFACVLKKRYPDARIKIWANDNDLLAISTAPNMVFELDGTPEYIREFMVKGRSGYAFNQTIRDAISFEYHDILNSNPFPELDIILARDLLSFLLPNDQARVANDFMEKLKVRGLILLGRNERLSIGEDWRAVGTDPVSAFMRQE
jgi:purine-binding chemotaxis protein CheW